ncbi:unnamed protein product [Dicrocoelium dendriticum]|nr:unnamed protein product [Dicrocoelium dendriticum]
MLFSVVFPCVPVRAEEEAEEEIPEESKKAEEEIPEESKKERRHSRKECKKACRKKCKECKGESVDFTFASVVVRFAISIS